MRLRWEHEAELKQWDERRALMQASSSQDEPGLFRQMFMGNLFSGSRKKDN
jgi:hypothetical protein